MKQQNRVTIDISVCKIKELSVFFYVHCVHAFSALSSLLISTLFLVKNVEIKCLRQTLSYIKEKSYFEGRVFLTICLLDLYLK